MAMMTSFVSDWITRVTFALIGCFATYALIHGVRDPSNKRILGVIIFVCMLILAHLPRIPGIVVTEQRPVVLMDPIRTDPVWVGDNLFAKMDRKMR
jgi:hypothetical protein